MAEGEVEVVVSEGLRRRLAALAALDAQPEMAQAKAQIGAMALQDQARGFAALSAGGGTWPELSDVTVILRRGTTKIYDEGDISAKRQNLKMLRETGRLYASLTPGAPGNILDVVPGAVRVGTNVAYAAVQQRGGMATFRFGEAEERRLEQNVSRVTRGRRTPAPRKGGKRHEWAKRGRTAPWNPFFFRLRAVLRKMAGKTYRVPPRPFLRAPTAGEIAKYARVVREHIGRVIGG
jgi:phage gpG-like protein